MAHEKSREHPFQVSPRQTPVVGIVLEVDLVVKIYKIVLQGRPEAGQRDENDNQYVREGSSFADLTHNGPI